jgi:hypothetical protein
MNNLLIPLLAASALLGGCHQVSVRHAVHVPVDVSEHRYVHDGVVVQRYDRGYPYQEPYRQPPHHLGGVVVVTTPPVIRHPATGYGGHGYPQQIYRDTYQGTGRHDSAPDYRRSGYQGSGSHDSPSDDHRPGTLFDNRRRPQQGDGDDRTAPLASPQQQGQRDDHRRTPQQNNGDDRTSPPANPQQQGQRDDHRRTLKQKDKEGNQDAGRSQRERLSAEAKPHREKRLPASRDNGRAVKITRTENTPARNKQGHAEKSAPKKTGKVRRETGKAEDQEKKEDKKEH